MLGVDESINEMKKTQKTESEKRKKNLDCTYPGNSVFQLGLDLDEANPLFGSIDSSKKKGSRTSTTISSHSSLQDVKIHKNKFESLF